MRVLLACFLLAICSFTASSQFLTGFVRDSIGAPIEGVQVHQFYNFEKSQTDSYGAFHLISSPRASDTIVFSKFGFYPTQLILPDTLSHHFNIVMENNPGSFDKVPTESPFGTREVWGQRIGLGFCFFDNDFSQFSSLLGNQAIDSIQGLKGLFEIEYGFFRKNGINWGMHLGFGLVGESKIDSLDVNYKQIQFGVSLGHHFVNTERFYAGPRGSIDWTRHKIQLYDSTSVVPLQTYLLNGERDFRIHQFTGFVGLEAAYKIYDDNRSARSPYGTIGGYIGWIWQLDTQTHVRTPHHDISSSPNLTIDLLTFGIFLRFDFPGYTKNRVLFR